MSPCQGMCLLTFTLSSNKFLTIFYNTPFSFLCVCIPWTIVAIMINVTMSVFSKIIAVHLSLSLQFPEVGGPATTVSN